MRVVTWKNRRALPGIGWTAYLIRSSGNRWRPAESLMKVSWFVYVYVSVYACLYVPMHVCMYIRMFTLICMCVMK
jgi:hypothetical protein